MEKRQSFTETFRERLGLFTFFHLGSDAEVRMTESETALVVSVAHSRVVPFEFTLSWNEVGELLADPNRFEAFMLDYLTRHRRS